jgi:hypothetical protein
LDVNSCLPVVTEAELSPVDVDGVVAAGCAGGGDALLDEDELPPPPHPLIAMTLTTARSTSERDRRWSRTIDRP